MQSHPDSVGGPTAEELLATARFTVPEVSAHHVHRARLSEALARAESLPLVVVSAPAGTGKTSLVADWVRASGGSVDRIGWVTFEDGESTFWEYLLECLSRLGLAVPDERLGPTGETRLGRQRLTALAALIAETSGRWTVVVDGYELVSLDIAREVDLLLRLSFGRLRLVFVGRVDPVLPLYRYRLREVLAEIRVADLAFTDAEAGQLLTSLGVSLPEESVHDLNERVRGWVAGLRFGARALAGREDAEESVGTVLAQTGDINEYLVGEVLDAQTPEVRQVLLETCVPDVLVPGLVDELGGSSAVHVLPELAKSAAFIEPVPDEPGAYRYYPFFRDLLRAQLAYESPQTMEELHRRAAGWFERHDLPARAIGHLAAVGDWDAVAVQIVEGLMVGRLLLEGPDGGLCDLGRRVPVDRGQRAACVVRAGVALAAGDRLTCAEELARARRTDTPDMAHADAARLSIAVLDAVRAGLAGDAETATAAAEQAERALDTSPARLRVPPGPELQALVGFSQGLAALRRGELDAAHGLLEAVVDLEAIRPYATFLAHCLGYLAVVEAMDGQLSRASERATESLSVAAGEELSPRDRPAAAYVALARVALERYRPEVAREHLVSAATCRSMRGDPVSHGLAEGIMAGVERADGRLQSALSRIEAASAVAAQTDPWLAGHLRVEAAKLSLASGRPDLALQELEAAVEQDRPEAAVVAATAYAEQGRDAAALDSLARAQDGEPPLQVQVSRLLVEVVQESRRRSPGRARAVLDRSLRLAAPEELRRPFREAVPSVQRLLSSDARLLERHRWLSQTVAIPAQRGAGSPARTSSAPRPEDQLGVVEALTPKELEVLRHLEELLTTEEIAEKMFVSVNTVRTHVRSILRKLGVNRRNAAVRRARDLELLDV